MQRLLPAVVIALACGATCFTGCGDANSHGQTLAPVQGMVKYLGQPLVNAQVVFLPDTPGQLPALGITDSSGHYELLTIVPGDGASLGKHRVKVIARGPDKTPAGTAPGTIVAGAPVEPGAPLIPEKYFSFDTSGLTAEVKEGGTTVNFDLSDK
ncbi:MAG: hypothetical protein L0211_16660 [Planctomycetaceae bacterium]|nr:hypothetical protein [Planctomycetaceae bacterium]